MLRAPLDRLRNSGAFVLEPVTTWVEMPPLLSCSKLRTFADDRGKATVLVRIDPPCAAPSGEADALCEILLQARIRGETLYNLLPWTPAIAVNIYAAPRDVKNPIAWKSLVPLGQGTIYSTKEWDSYGRSDMDHFLRK
jgi:hypothetical protein